MREIRQFLEIKIFESGDFELYVFHLANIILIFLAARLMVWLFKKFISRRSKDGADIGKQYAIVQLVSYVIYVTAIVIAIDSLGVRITVLLAGSTALLVGLGLGLQDFFRDLVAGFIILSERTVTAGDIVEIGGLVAQVKDVGLRTTSLLTREDIVIIVPNTQLTTQTVINWSQSANKIARFEIKARTDYGSDTAKVRELLIKSARAHKEVKKIPEPSVFFDNFGENAIEFRLVFFSGNLFRIERTKSDIRFEIDRNFREAGIKVPVPQRDLWVRQFPDDK